MMMVVLCLEGVCLLIESGLVIVTVPIVVRRYVLFLLLLLIIFPILHIVIMRCIVHTLQNLSHPNSAVSFALLRIEVGGHPFGIAIRNNKVILAVECALLLLRRWSNVRDHSLHAALVIIHNHWVIEVIASRSRTVIVDTLEHGVVCCCAQVVTCRVDWGETTSSDSLGRVLHHVGEVQGHRRGLGAISEDTWRLRKGRTYLGGELMIRIALITLLLLLVGVRLLIIIRLIPIRWELCHQRWAQKPFCNLPNINLRMIILLIVMRTFQSFNCNLFSR